MMPATACRLALAPCNRPCSLAAALRVMIDWMAGPATPDRVMTGMPNQKINPLGAKPKMAVPSTAQSMPIRITLGEPRVILIGMLCAVLGTAIFGFAPSGLIFWFGIPVMTLSGVAGPAIQSIMTRRAAANEQGRLQGANASLQAVAGIIAPVLFGEAYSLAYALAKHSGSLARHSSGGPVVLGAPFLLASLFLVIGVVLAVQNLRKPVRT